MFKSPQKALEYFCFYLVISISHSVTWIRYARSLSEDCPCKLGQVHSLEWWFLSACNFAGMPSRPAGVTLCIEFRKYVSNFNYFF